jgi:hypothetical protein
MHLKVDSDYPTTPSHMGRIYHRPYAASPRAHKYRMESIACFAEQAATSAECSKKRNSRAIAESEDEIRVCKERKRGVVMGNRKRRHVDRLKSLENYGWSKMTSETK